MLTLYNSDCSHPNFTDCQPSSLQTNKKPSNEENYYKIQRNVFSFAKKTDEQTKRKKQTNKQTNQKKKKEKSKSKQNKNNLKQNKQTSLYISGNCFFT